MDKPSAGAAAQDEPSVPKAFSVSAPDGVIVSAQEWGVRGGREVVLIHGFMQSHRCWAKQVQSPLTDEFRMITYDIRGHGGSDRIMDAAFYGDGVRFADELDAVLRTAGLRKPVLVGWSYGTRVITDYVMKYGTSRIAAINYVGAAVSGDARHLGPAAALIPGTFAEEAAENVAATRAFVRACFAKPPTPEEFEAILAYNMLVPAQIRRWLRRPAPYEATLKRIDVPVLVTHGAEDQVMRLSLGEYVAATVPGARASYYPGVGHSPFWEEPERFNRELAEFARETAAPQA